MYTVTFTSDPLNPGERAVFNHHLKHLGLDETLWDVYNAFLNTPSKHSIPGTLRFTQHGVPAGIIFLIKCMNYGETVSKNPFIQKILRNTGIPVYVWMKSGIAAENFANPGFINTDIKGFTVEHMVQLARKKLPVLFIHDLKANANQFPKSLTINYPDDGIINTGQYNTVKDYLSEHKNLKKKLRHYEKNGGRVDVLKGKLDEELQENIRKSVLSTASRSLFKLPYQENYARMGLSSSRIDNKGILHFICRSDKHFFGYHTFVQFRKQMRCMNGAFNRELPTTHHAYENMIYRSVEYGIDQSIREIHYGPVLNETKKRMMGKFNPTRLYLYTSLPVMAKIAGPVLKRSRLQNNKMAEFSDIGSAKN